MKTIAKIRTYLIVCMLGVMVLSFEAVPTTQAQPANMPGGGEGNGGCRGTFLTLPAWYNGLANGPDCDISSPNDVGGIGPFIWKIALNIIELLLRLSGYAAVGFIIYGGYKYMISAGSPEGMVAARKTIMNAAIGLVISIAAVAIVNTIANAF